MDSRGPRGRLRRMNLRLVTSLVVLAALVAALGASSAQAGSTCHRSNYGIQCEVWYQPYVSGSDVMRFGIRNNYDPDRNIVETDRGWLDGTNDVTKRTWHGHLGRRAWRGRDKLWRACTVGWSPHFACAPWVWQGPPPFGA
jgi:hypothetical protein